MNRVVASPVLLRPTPRFGVTFVEGDGARLTADDGSTYLDFAGGIAVVGLGHGHPEVVAAAHRQLDRLWHVSNLYWTEPMADLADRLSARFGGAQAFFCNSGAEAVEAALKYARKATGRHAVAALEGSFHGRTLGALAVTGQPAKRQAFEPLPGPVAFARPNDDRLARGRDRAGDGARHPGAGPRRGRRRPARARVPGSGGRARGGARRAAGLRRDPDRRGEDGDVLRLGAGGVRPDLVTLAKGLANGLPLGCLLVADEAAGEFEPGDHASTFGGNPVACAAACAVCDAIDEDLLARVGGRGEELRAGLGRLGAVRESRGCGLLIGAELDRPAGAVAQECLEHGLLVTSAGERVLRLTPPLTIERADIDEALDILGEVLA